jgi:D-arabinose 1-dehydrogenase-like Zn-dependent alcohol dehydrogenase
LPHCCPAATAPGSGPRNEAARDEGVGHYVTELAVASGAADVTAVSANPERGARLAVLSAAVVAEPANAPSRYDIVIESAGSRSRAADSDTLGG